MASGIPEAGDPREGRLGLLGHGFPQVPSESHHSDPLQQLHGSLLTRPGSHLGAIQGLGESDAGPPTWDSYRAGCEAASSRDSKQEEGQSPLHHGCPELLTYLPGLSSPIAFIFLFFPGPNTGRLPPPSPPSRAGSLRPAFQSWKDYLLR